ncbi:MAG: NADH-ubiquinone oxidoreductase-F iron-sulfur binding region domain-containing protein, partial [Woeseiaceae bacterium]|nr:NADH-ubiquinone oxidoreductase-F iron-sulfur binding region domain-containing protein [Woeseiaceae bacterium]
MARTKVFVPRETSAVSVGADDVAVAIARKSKAEGTDIELIRNGSWGACWLEPLVEVEVDGVRIAYGNVEPGDVEELFASDFLNGGKHAKRLGPIQEVPYLIRQDRWSFFRVGLIDPLSIDGFRATQGFKGLEKAFEIGSDAVIEAVKESGLRGRGGAGFPTGIKWRTVADTESAQKYIACNADEGDSGTFSDRMLMEGDPMCLIEGMAIAGYAVGANKGYIYLRSEYPLTHTILQKALERCRDAGWLGKDIQGSGFDFDIDIHLGAGSYVCGEETAMLESLEGKKGIVRYKPPLPAIEGLFGKPTVVNNVVTLASVPNIVNLGSERYAGFGVNRSKGTLAFQLAGNIKRGGLVEKAFGITLRELIDDFGGGTASGRPVKAVQVGGPLGAYIPAEHLDTPLDYEAFIEIGGMIGHGGIVVFDDLTNMAQQARFAMEFCAIESCGKCTPCRIGSTRGVEVIDRMIAGENRDENYDLLVELCDTMEDASLCAMGGMTPYP